MIRSHLNDKNNNCLWTNCNFTVFLFFVFVCLLVCLFVFFERSSIHLVYSVKLDDNSCKDRLNHLFYA